MIGLVVLTRMQYVILWCRPLLAVVALSQGVVGNNLEQVFLTISDGINAFDKFRVLSTTYRGDEPTMMLASLLDHLCPSAPLRAVFVDDLTWSSCQDDRPDVASRTTDPEKGGQFLVCQCYCVPDWIYPSKGSPSTISRRLSELRPSSVGMIVGSDPLLPGPSDFR